VQAHLGTSTLLDSLCPCTPPLPLPLFTTCSAFLLRLLYLSTHLPAYSSTSFTSILHWLCCARGCVTVRVNGTPRRRVRSRCRPHRVGTIQLRVNQHSVIFNLQSVLQNSKGLTIVELGTTRESNRCLSSVRGVAVSTSSWP
jgi:hypothetical protein